MANLIRGVHHIALKCQGMNEFEKTVHFYHDLLEMPIVRSWGEGEHLGIMLDAGGSLMEIFSDAPDTLPQGAVRHFALATDDVDAAVAKISAEGYEITAQPNDITIASNPPFPARIAFCIGPVGEEIEFFCEK